MDYAKARELDSCGADLQIMLASALVDKECDAGGAESGYLLSKSVKIIIYAVQDNRTWS